MVVVTGVLECNEHGEFEVTQEVDPPILSDQVDIFGSYPDCDEECSGTVPLKKW